MRKILFLLFTITSASTSLGRCPTIPIQQDFEIDKYMGKWHQEIRDKEISYENGECNIVEYVKDQNDTIKIKSSELKGKNWNHILSSAYCESNKGQCYLRFFDVSPIRDYKIVTTDYETYSVVYTCTNYLIFHISHAWLLTRQLGIVDLEYFAEILQNLGIKSENLLYTKNNNCPLM